MKIFIKNPCKYCITRPACRATCKDYKKYQNRFESMASGSLILIITSFAIWCSYGLWSSIVAAKFAIISVWVFCYYFSITKMIKEDMNSFNDLKKYQKALVVMVSPFGEFTFFLIDSLNLGGPVDNFCYRYIKHNHPSKKAKSGGYTRKAH